MICNITSQGSHVDSMSWEWKKRQVATMFQEKWRLSTGYLTDTLEIIQSSIELRLVAVWPQRQTLTGSHTQSLSSSNTRSFGNIMCGDKQTQSYPTRVVPPLNWWLARQKYGNTAILCSCDNLGIYSGLNNFTWITRSPNAANPSKRSARLLRLSDSFAYRGIMWAASECTMIPIS